MPFPRHLKKFLPSIITTPQFYFDIVHMIQTPEQCNKLKLALCEEMGKTYQYFSLVFHMSCDILDVRFEHFAFKQDCLEMQALEEEKQEILKLKEAVISINAEQFQEKLKHLYPALKPLREEMVSLI